MRIVHVSDCYAPRVGGIEMQVRDLARHQRAAGHTVSVITTTGGGPVGDSEDQSLHRTSGRRSRPGRIHYRHSPRGCRALLAQPFDLVHVHASTFSPLAFLAARGAALRGLPTVVTLHSLWGSATPLFGAADALTGWGDWPVVWSAVSDVAAGPLRSVLAGRADVSILSNGIDPREWEGPRHRGTPAELRLISVMRLAPRKRPLFLLQVLRELHRLLPPSIALSADIVGDGSEQGRMSRYLHHHKMGSWVSLRGQLSRSEIRTLYRERDVFVAPAALESFGIAALEARCAGLPVVARRSTGIREFITDGVDGILVDSDAAMPEALRAFACSPQTRARLSGCGRPAPRGVSWREVLEACERLYLTARLIQPCAARDPLPELVARLR